jgi:hypothetical protein
VSEARAWYDFGGQAAEVSSLGEVRLISAPPHRRTTLMPCHCQGYSPSVFLLREELRDGRWAPIAYGIADAVVTKDGQPGFVKPFEEGHCGECPLCFLNLMILWKESDTSE